MSNKKHGKFIVVEGMEGAGKTTAIRTISDYLTPLVSELIVTREPGGTRVGDKVRALLTEEVAGEVLDPHTELLLLYAARIQHVTEVIKPALQRGDWVLSDRFELSTLAYQGGGRGIALPFIEQISALCLQGFSPDLTFFLDIQPEQGLQRVRMRGEFDRIESESLAFFQRIYQTYHRLLAKMDNVIMIDASQSLPMVQKSIVMHLERFYEQK